MRTAWWWGRWALPEGPARFRPGEGAGGQVGIGQ